MRISRSSLLEEFRMKCSFSALACFVLMCILQAAAKLVLAERDRAILTGKAGDLSHKSTSACGAQAIQIARAVAPNMDAFPIGKNPTKGHNRLVWWYSF